MKVPPISLLIGIPVPSLIGGVGAGPTLGVRGAGALPVLRLYVPVLIFGAGSVAQTASGLSASAQSSLLGRLLVPWAPAPPCASGAAKGWRRGT